MNALTHVMKQQRTAIVICKNGVSLVVPHIVGLGINRTWSGYEVVVNTTSTSHISGRPMSYVSNVHSFETYDEAEKFTQQIHDAIQNFYN